MGKKKTVETLAVVILDESGSMGVVQQQTINGFNEYIQTLKAKSEPFLITLVKFGGTRVEKVHDNLALKDVPELTPVDYKPDGMTPLFDAIGRTIEQSAKAIAGQKTKPNVIFMIMTDGQENSSSDYNQSEIAELIKRMETNSGWVFTYLGANQDAFKAAKNLNIDVSNLSNYMAANPREAFQKMGRASLSYAQSVGTVKRGLMSDQDDNN